MVRDLEENRLTKKEALSLAGHARVLGIVEGLQEAARMARDVSSGPCELLAEEIDQRARQRAAQASP